LIKYDANLHLLNLKEILLRKILPQPEFDLEPGTSLPFRDERLIQFDHQSMW